MAIWCEKDGKNIMITCPQDFENLVEPGVYEAMREFFVFDTIGPGSESRIQELEDKLNDAYDVLKEVDPFDDYDELVSRCDDLDLENDNLKQILKDVAEMVAKIPEAQKIKEYLEEHEEEIYDYN